MNCILLGGPLDGDEHVFPSAPEYLRQSDQAEKRGVHSAAWGHYVYLRRDLDVTAPERLAAALRRNIDAAQVMLYECRGWEKGRRT